MEFLLEIQQTVVPLVHPCLIRPKSTAMSVPGTQAPSRKLALVAHHVRCSRPAAGCVQLVSRPTLRPSLSPFDHDNTFSRRDRPHMGAPPGGPSHSVRAARGQPARPARTHLSQAYFGPVHWLLRDKDIGLNLFQPTSRSTGRAGRRSYTVPWVASGVRV